MIPESQHFKSLTYEPVIPFMILIFISRMLTSINFYNDPPLVTNKIYYIFPNWLLPLEFQFLESLRSEMFP